MAAPAFRQIIILRKVLNRLLFHQNQRKLCTASNLKNLKQLKFENSKLNCLLTVKGWVRDVRTTKRATFIDLCDGSTQKFQVVVRSDLMNRWITFGSCLSISGKLVSSIGPEQAVEFLAESIDVIGPCDSREISTYPFMSKVRHTSSFTRQHLHFRPRTNLFATLLRIRNSATNETHRFYQDLGFIQVHTPLLTSNDCEGAGEVFLVQPSSTPLPQAENSYNDDNNHDGDDHSDESKTGSHFFDKPVYLTVSAQLHLETVAHGMSKVYTFSPAFRAENTVSRHHLAEFYMVEAEIAFADSLSLILENSEELMKVMSKRVLENCMEDVNIYFKHVAPKNHQNHIENIILEEFKRLSYTEAIDILSRHGFASIWGSDLNKAQEDCLVKHCGKIPVFITDWPREIKPFYMRLNDDGKTVACFDLLFPEVGEMCGGSLREERLDALESVIAKQNLREKLSWYVDLRRHGSAPTGGYGLGFERCLQWLLGIKNIKDAIPFPRWTHHCQL